MRKDFLEHILFISGSLLTCALVLWIAKVQAATEHSNLIEVGRHATDVMAQTVSIPTNEPSSWIESSNGGFCPRHATEVASILDSRYAARIDESSIRTNLPEITEPERVEPEMNAEIADLRNEPEIPVRNENSIEQLCSSNFEPEMATNGTFSLAATRLLCESVGSNEDLFQKELTTFIASER